MTEPSQYFKGRTVQEQMNEVIGYVDTRAAEVATTAITSDVAQVHQDMLDADADAQAAAASAAAAAGTLANAVKKTGEASQSIAGDIIVSGAVSVGSLGVGAHAALVDATVSGHISVPAPTANGYAANKKYVDDNDFTMDDPENPTRDSDLASPGIVVCYTEEDHERLKSWIANAGTPLVSRVPGQVQAIIDEEISAYFGGVGTPEDCAAKIQSRVSIWLAEHK